MKKPNFDFERRERDKAKALKKAEKLAAKASKGQSDIEGDTQAGAGGAESAPVSPPSAH